MSCVCILTPVVIAAWPAFSAAVVAAATSLGYTVVDESIKQSQTAKQTDERKITLEIDQSEIVTNQLGRDQHIKVTRGGITVAFSRDARGKASVCITGEGFSDDELRIIGEELSQRVVQKYVYKKLMDEMQARGFNVVEDETNADNSIRLKVRHWDN